MGAELAGYRYSAGWVAMSTVIQVSDRSQGQIRANKQLWGSLTVSIHSVTLGSYYRCTAVEACDWSQTGGLQVHSWKTSYMKTQWCRLVLGVRAGFGPVGNCGCPCCQHAFPWLQGLIKGEGTAVEERTSQTQYKSK